MSSVGQLQAETIGRPELLGVVMMRLLAVDGNSCLTMRSLIVLLTICWLVEVRALST